MRASLLLLSVTLVLSPACPAAGDFLSAIRSSNAARIMELSPVVEDINQVTDRGRSALMVIARAGRCDDVRLLLGLGADTAITNENGGNALMFAVVSGDNDCVEPILQTGVDINARGINGWGALMIAAAKGHVETARLLIDHGADINARDIYVWTPLHRAAYHGHEAVVDLLLAEPGIDMNARDDHGATALHHAAARGHAAVAASLLLHGASLGAEDLDGRTPVTYVSEQGHESMVQVLDDAARKGN
jgi:ankyrin repeat protein